MTKANQKPEADCLMSQANHKTQMAVASLMDAMRAMRRGKLELVDEHLDKAERDLMIAAELQRREHLVDTFR